MAKKTLPRLASVALIGAVAVMPVAASVGLSVAVATPAAAVGSLTDDPADVDTDHDGVSREQAGITTLSGDVEIEPISIDFADDGDDAPTGTIEYRDENGNLVDPPNHDDEGIDRSDLTREVKDIEPISADMTDNNQSPLVIGAVAAGIAAAAVATVVALRRRQNMDADA
ncbi:MAG: hypothetical protein LBB54_00065 [Cellulomonadaceae bacterium]|jgi:hypothetical protein|nr:hypothetical protein [Cellulomonadaceae bacterium]